MPLVEIEHKGVIQTDEMNVGDDLLDGDLVLPIDWDGIRSNTQKAIDEAKLDYANYNSSSYDGQITETDDEMAVEVSISISASYGEQSISITSELMARYLKADGVALFISINNEIDQNGVIEKFVLEYRPQYFLSR